MKVRIDLEDGETLEQAEDDLFKALKGKKKAKEQLGERYADDLLNEFHDSVLARHLDVMEDIKTRVEEEVRRLASSR